MAVCLTTASAADVFTTAGDGTTYNFAALAAIEGSGVTTTEANIFEVSQSVSIAPGDKFVCEGGITVNFAKGVEFKIQGDADFNVAERTTFCAPDPADKTSRVHFYYNDVPDNDFVTVTNIDFNRIGVRHFGDKGMHISNCTFHKHHGKDNAAITFSKSGSSFTVVDCQFDSCQTSAIAGAANYLNPVTMENCRLYHNTLANRNRPQINLTCADSVIIRNCEVIGCPDNTLVGGIAVANLMGGTYGTTLIENCYIRDNRYGITLTGNQRGIVRNNVLIDNNKETNPMNGGSGINVTDNSQQQVTNISGNYIEGHYWGVSIIGGADIRLGKPAADDFDSPGGNVFVNNGCNGELYDLYNNSPNTVFAQDNTWNVDEQTEEKIETVIFHQADNPSLGLVIFMPAATTTAVNTISREDEVPVVYNLQGLRLSGRTTKGIFIEGGKKKVVR